MRCFALTAEFSLEIEDKTIKNIENSIKNGFVSYKKPTLFNELHKILSYKMSNIQLIKSFSIVRFKTLNSNLAQLV